MSNITLRRVLRAPAYSLPVILVMALLAELRAEEDWRIAEQARRGRE